MNNEDINDTSPSPALLHPIGPDDLTIYIHATPHHGRYTYRMIDNTTGLSHACVRILEEADDTALALLAVHDSLKTIQKNRVNELLMERYGFRTRSAVLASGKCLRVRLVVTDPDLAKLGAIVTKDGDALEFFRLRSEHDYRIWQIVTGQTQRFDTTWDTTSADDPLLVALDKWADNVLGRSSHEGPVYSQKRRPNLPIEFAEKIGVELVPAIQ